MPSTGSANTDIVAILGGNTLDGAAALPGIASRVLSATATPVATAADTNETDLFSYTVPANLLGANAKGLRLTAWGVTGATANGKTVNVKFGGTTVLTSAAQAINDNFWRVQVEILRSGASAQTAVGIVQYGANSGSASTTTRGVQTTAAIDTTAAIIFKVTGLNGTAAANDIILRGAIVETLN
jgi:hypothetical protein